MKELFARLLSRPFLFFEMLAASLLANILALAMPLFVTQVLNRYIAQGVDATLATLSAGAVIAIVFEFAFRQVRFRMAANISSTFDRAAAIGVFETLSSIKAEAFDRLSPGLRQELISGADKLQAAYSPANITALMDVPFALLYIAVLFVINPVIAWVAGIFIGVTFLLSLLTFVSLRGPSQGLQQSTIQRAEQIGAIAQASDSVRVFNAGRYARRKWRSTVEAMQGLQKKLASRQGLSQSISQSAQAMLGVSIIATGAVLVVQGQLDVGAMIGANILASRALGPIVRLAALSEPMAKASQAIKLFGELAKIPREREQGTALKNYHGEIEFKDLAFGYMGSKAPLFESINLKLEPGTVLVFTGSNGSGKTTMARLLAGLIEPSRGKLLVDGVDLTQIAPEWWRKQISYMQQEPKFLTASISDNLKTNNPEISDDALADVIKSSELAQFIDQSPDGLDTVMGRNGGDLSLGIRRRMALARALVTDGKVLIVDEPTEGLDAEGRNAVVTVMNKIARSGRTVIAFSTDPDIIKAAPNIVDLDVKPVPQLVRKKSGKNLADKGDDE